MRVTCEHCQQALAIPDEKVPDRAFSLTCPKCKGTIRVDPTTPAPPPAQASRPAPEPPAPEPPAPEPEPPAPPTPSGPPRDPEPPPAVRPAEQALLDTVTPSAFLVGLTRDDERAALKTGLSMLSISVSDTWDDVATAVQALATASPGVVLIRGSGAFAPAQAPAPSLAPLERLTPTARRAVFVALIADGVRSLDGQLAFVLGVDCVLDAGALHTLPTDLRRALLTRQQRYRHWHRDDDA